MKKIGIIGFSSFTKEILCNLKNKIDIFVSDNYYNQDSFNSTIPNIKTVYDCNVYKLNNFKSSRCK
jgi:hypothetical protein